MRRDAAERQETMNRPFLGLACLALLLAMVQRCDTGTPGDLDSSGARMGTIRGTVMVGGSPLGGAQVSLTGTVVTREATTGTDGAFGFADLPAGLYTVAVSLAGVACESATAEIAAGETVTTSIACAEQLGTITGTVRAGGAPIPGIRVNLSALGRTATTDAEGVFTIGSVPTGTHTLEASPNITTCESVSAQVDADQTATADIACQPIGRILGRVEWSGSFIFFPVILTASGPVSRQVQVTSEEVRFDDVPAGDYAVAGTVEPASGVAADCQSVNATVQVEQVTSVVIVCELTGSPPMASATGKIAFERAGRIMVVDPEGGNAVNFIDGLAPSWSADGRKLVFQRPGCPDRSVPPFASCDDVWVVNADGSGLAPITNSEYVHDHEPVWSPDGRKVAFIRFWHGPDQDYLVVVDANEPPALWSETVPSQWWPYSRPAWSADGTRIAFTCQGSPPGWEFDICVVPSNNHVGYFTNSTSDWGAGLVKLTNDTWTDSDPAWSPDGTRIAFTTNRNSADGRTYIALISPNGSGFTRLVPGRRPAWSPDGTRIVFVGEASAPGLYVLNLDGSGLMRITDNPADAAPSWGR